MNILSIFRRQKPAPVIVQTYTKRQIARPSINDALHTKLKAEVAARSHERFADDVKAHLSGGRG